MEQQNLDGLLDLEENYYNEGYRLGLADGARAGRSEGRIFGMQKGFEKYVELGHLSGNAAVWEARLASDTSSKSLVPELPSNARLEKNLKTFSSLVDPQTLDTQNTEEAVSHFDERLKSALTKAKIIENITVEPNADQPSSRKTTARSSGQGSHIDVSEQVRSQDKAPGGDEWF